MPISCCPSLHHEEDDDHGDDGRNDGGVGEADDEDGAEDGEDLGQDVLDVHGDHQVDLGEINSLVKIIKILDHFQD